MGKIRNKKLKTPFLGKVKDPAAWPWACLPARSPWATRIKDSLSRPQQTPCHTVHHKKWTGPSWQLLRKNTDHSRWLDLERVFSHTLALSPPGSSQYPESSVLAVCFTSQGHSGCTVTRDQGTCVLFWFCHLPASLPCASHSLFLGSCFSISILRKMYSQDFFILIETYCDPLAKTWNDL